MLADTLSVASSIFCKRSLSLSLLLHDAMMLFLVKCFLFTLSSCWKKWPFRASHQRQQVAPWDILFLFLFFCAIHQEWFSTSIHTPWSHVGALWDLRALGLHLCFSTNWETFLYRSLAKWKEEKWFLSGLLDKHSDWSTLTSTFFVKYFIQFLHNIKDYNPGLTSNDTQMKVPSMHACLQVCLCVWVCVHVI